MAQGGAAQQPRDAKALDHLVMRLAAGKALALDGHRADDENVAEAVETFVSKKVENADIENYTLADAVVEVAIENFIDDPISALKIDVQNIVLSEIGQDLTQDQKTKAAETVVPVVIVGQIIATPIRRRF